MTRSVNRLAFLVLALCLLAAGPAPAQDRGRGTPGEFDYYVLALSWSPSFCEASEERGSDRAPQQQCGARPYSFVVHGLWPQYEPGFPQNCQIPPPRLNRNIVSEMLDLMPGPRLVYHEWDAHGTCSGLEARAYFDTVRKARERVKIPDEFSGLRETRTVTPDEVRDAFIASNSGLAPAGIVVTCDNRRLREIRVCLSRDLQFGECPGSRRGACRRDRLVMPPVRGG